MTHRDTQGASEASARRGRLGHRTCMTLHFALLLVLIAVELKRRLPLFKSPSGVLGVEGADYVGGVGVGVREPLTKDSLFCGAHVLGHAFILNFCCVSKNI